jgi:hypothetical protein
MKNLKSYDQFVNERDNYIPNTSIDNREGSVTNIMGEEDLGEYMFFQNLKTIKECAELILSMNPEKVNDILRDGHAWAVDHIATSKDDVEEVCGFLKGRMNESRINEAKTADFHRIFAMTPTWWVAWKAENGDKYEIEKDAFSKTYEVKDKDGKSIFVFDYGRNKIFTNEDPQMFVLKGDVSQEELEDAKKKAEKITKATGTTDSNEPDDQGVEDTETADADTKNSDTEEE